MTIAALAVAVVVFFAGILVGGLNLYLRDVARSFYPERRVLAEILRSGELPFWNPYVSGGQPLAASAPKRARIYSEADGAELHEKPRVLPSGIVAWITRHGLYPEFVITFGFDGIIDADASRTNLRRSSPHSDR